VVRAPARMTPALTGMTVLLSTATVSATAQIIGGEHSGRAPRGAMKGVKGSSALE
jgi:hypothetical protein